MGRKMTDTMDMSPSDDIQLEIPDAVQTIMEKRMIRAEDIRQVLLFAERTGNKLRGTVSGNYLSNCKLSGVTFWVEYSQKGGQYLIHNAYSHRMEILEEER